MKVKFPSQALRVDYAKLLIPTVDYLLRSCIVDKFLLAMTLLFLERAGLTAKGFQKDRYFFYSLFLAIGTFSLLS